MAIPSDRFRRFPANAVAKPSPSLPRNNVNREKEGIKPRKYGSVLAFIGKFWEFLPLMHTSDGTPQERPEIASPFSAARTNPTDYRRTRKSRKTWPYFLIAVALILVVGGIVAFTYLKDPYRKLEAFPTDRYFSSFQSLSGLKFRSDLRVEADLGWKEGVGRLMVFTITGEDRPLVVFIPPALGQIFFNKGQKYLMALEVKEGGLIYADSCRKN